MESATYYAYIPFMFYPTFGNVQSQKSGCLFATQNAQSSALNFKIVAIETRTVAYGET